MIFSTVKASVTAILANAAVGRYRVSGYQERNISDEEVARSDRLVKVYYKRGDFSRAASGRGPFAHDVTLNIELTVSEPATCDLTVLHDPMATPGEIAAAIAAMEPAEARADDAMDLLWSIVFEELMKGDNIDLGVGFLVANRWIPSFEKGDVIPRGRYAVLTGDTTLSFRVEEDVESTDTNELEFVDVTLTLAEDTDEKAGVIEVF